MVAAGSGTRMGGTPKQFRNVDGVPMVVRSVNTAREVSDGVVVVMPPLPGSVPDTVTEALAGAADVTVTGADTRSGSVRCGLDALGSRIGDNDVVVIHDAARPFASPHLFTAVVDAVRAGSDAAVPGVPVVDTIKETAGGIVVATPDRNRLVAVQTPQAFRFGVLRHAHNANPEATDDASVVEAEGGRVVVVSGEASNIKITTEADLAAVHSDPKEAPAAAPGRSEAAVGLRIGHGFDIHRFTDNPGRALVLGGVTIDGARGLEGHSDADVIAHACADALLGAVGLGDIGQHFADTDPAYAGADSLVLLEKVVHMIRTEGWNPVNIDCSVVAEQPRLAPHRDAMQQRLGDVVGAPVSIKGNRAEQLGSLGRSEGIACMAVALVAR